MSTVHSLAEVIVGRIGPAAVWIENVSSIGPSVAAQVQDRLARTVARQLGLGSVGVEDPQPRDVAGLVGLGQQQDPVGRDARVNGADRLDPRGRQLELERRGLDDHVVVAERMPLLELHAAAVYV